MSEERTWSSSAAHVRKALAFIKAKGAVTPEQLVEWDAKHGKRLFTWDDVHAGAQFRLVEARWFFNAFRAKFNGMRVRAFIHLHEDEARGIDRAGYYTVEEIAKQPSMREVVVGDITRRMASLASELKMWKLSDSEQDALFERLREAMSA